MIRNSISRTCADLVEYLKFFITCPNFINRHKTSPKDFTRQRKLSFQMLVLFLINLVKGSYQDELDHFFKSFLNIDVVKRVISKAALCKARKKLKFSAFLELNNHLVEFFYSKFKIRKWFGFNLLAIDGSTLKLLKYQEITEHFGLLTPKNGDPCPMARISQLFDVLNKVTVDAIINPYNIGERELLKNHLLKLLPNDLLLLDRGYPAYWIFNLIMTLDGNFCSRISKQWKIVNDFIQSGQKETIISLQPSYVSKKECAKMGLDPIPLELRLIRIELESGEIEVLITSLTDDQKYPHEIFADLYHQRWPIEEDYKTMKTRIDIGNFSGESVSSVYQDFHAKILAKNLTSVFVHPAQDIVDSQSQGKKYPYQVNLTQAISKSKDTIVLLFQRTRNTCLNIIYQLHDIFIATTEPIRHGRKYKRNHKINTRSHYMNYKPCR